VSSYINFLCSCKFVEKILYFFTCGLQFTTFRRFLPLLKIVYRQKWARQQENIPVACLGRCYAVDRSFSKAKGKQLSDCHLISQGKLAVACGEWARKHMKEG
jgi:hypothetical protein